MVFTIGIADMGCNFRSMKKDRNISQSVTIGLKSENIFDFTEYKDGITDNFVQKCFYMCEY